jgi:hypothetical protein
VCIRTVKGKRGKKGEKLDDWRGEMEKKMRREKD